MRDENVSVTSTLVEHPLVSPAFSYRFDASDRSIVISGDTARSDSLISLARGADVLVHEALWVPAVDRIVARNPNASTLRSISSIAIPLPRIAEGSRKLPASRHWCSRTSCQVAIRPSPIKCGSMRRAGIFAAA